MRLLKQSGNHPRKIMRPMRTPSIDDRIVTALKLIKEADSVELKLTVPDSDRQSAITTLDLDVLDAELRQVVFFDTPDLDLDRAGMVLRARRSRKGGDVVVKLRPVVPAEIPSKLRRSSAFTIEVDVMPGSFVCSGSLKSKADNPDVKQVLQGKRPIRKLFLPEQQSLFRKHAPKGLELDSLTPFGPINVAKLKFAPGEFKGRVAVAELWFYPDGTRILELSIKCAHDEAFEVLEKMRALLMSRGIALTGTQQTKTRMALEYFSRLTKKTRSRTQPRKAGIR